MTRILVIVPCGKRKIWDKYPNAGSTHAKDVYTSPAFRTNRLYAEKFGNSWIILSALHGFIEPSFLITEPYNVTFKSKKSMPIHTDRLLEQVEELRLSENSVVIGLGGKEYRDAIKAAFNGTPARLEFPFAGGLASGRMRQATVRAIAAGNPMIGVAFIKPMPTRAAFHAFKQRLQHLSEEYRTLLTQ